MKITSAVAPAVFLLSLFLSVAFAAKPTSGFFLPDSVNEMTLEYRTVKGLILLPVTLNDSIQVNLILDTGCRNLILFGKRFKNLFKMNSAKPVEFSGLGSGRPVTGTLSIGNKVSINEVLGEQIPIVVVGNTNLFGYYKDVHGVIGHDIFLKFEVELNAQARTITFRKAAKSAPPAGYTRIPLRIVDARPLMQSQVFMDKDQSHTFDLMIDTGSSLGLLLKSTNVSALVSPRKESIIGIGFNGPLSGYKIITRKVSIAGMDLMKVPTGIVSSQWHNNASIGMEILKDYILVLNYCKAYACFKRNDV